HRLGKGPVLVDARGGIPAPLPAARRLPGAPRRGEPSLVGRGAREGNALPARDEQCGTDARGATLGRGGQDYLPPATGPHVVTQESPLRPVHLVAVRHVYVPGQLPRVRLPLEIRYRQSLPAPVDEHELEQPR